MKKLLILAYDFPPYVSVGALRPYAWYKYLKEYGIEPIVITRQWSNHYGNHLDYIAPGYSNETIIEQTEAGTIIRTPYKPNLANKLMLKYGNNKYRLLRKIISAYYEFAQFFYNTGPKVQLYYAAKHYLKHNKADAIIATADPFVLFRYANKLSKKFNIPWIADYRDPWSQIKSNKKNSFLILWDKYFEKKYIKHVSIITTVTELLQNQLQTIFSGKKTLIIRNGFNPEIIHIASNIKQNSQILKIAFMGTIEKYHPIEIFLSGFNKFVNNLNNKNVSLEFYGTNIPDTIQELINHKYPNIKENVKIFPKMENIELIKKLAECNIMLLFNYFSIVGTKIYDYLALNRLILFCFQDDPDAFELKRKFYHHLDGQNHFTAIQEKIINQTNAGIIVKDQNHIFEVLNILYDEFTSKKEIKIHSHDYHIYSRKYQTQLLAGIINNMHNPRLIEQLQCQRCVMDTSDPDITFDQQGFCNHCTDYLNRLLHQTYQGKASDEQLQNLLTKVRKKGKNKAYDCVIGVSGGVDSLYVLWLAKTQWHLRPLAVHMDNGWNSELAVDNIEKICKKLNVDLHTEVLDYQEFANLQLSFLQASVIEAETPTDIAIPAVLHKVAAQYGIKYVFSGGNYATEGILPKFWHYNAKDTKYLFAIHKRFGKIPLKTFPTFGYKKEFYYKFFKGIRMAYPLNKVPYDKKEAVRVLEQELGWRNYGGKHHESIYTKWVQGYYLYTKFGIDYRKATYSSQICTGAFTREQALEDLKNLPYNPATLEADIEYLCKKLYITREEYNQIMQKPAKTYKNYPNNEKFLNFIYKLYKKLT